MTLLIVDIVGAWSDTRVFRCGHWQFEDAAPALRSLHYVAGGQFYAIRKAPPVRDNAPPQ